MRTVTRRIQVFGPFLSRNQKNSIKKLNTPIARAGLQGVLKIVNLQSPIM